MRAVLIFIFLAKSCLSETITSTCNGLEPTKMVLPSAVGRWYLVKATRLGNPKDPKNTCGFFNTIKPCSCIGVNIESAIPPPRVTNYTLRNFGYNEKFNAYALTKIQLSSLSNDSLLFNAYVPLAKVNFKIAVLGTDDYLSWMSLAMCDQLKNQQGELSRIIWIVSRSPLATNETLSKAINSTVHATNEPSNDIIDVDQWNCPPIF